MQEESQSKPSKQSSEPPSSSKGWANISGLFLFLLLVSAVVVFLEVKTQKIEAVSIQPLFFLEEEALSQIPITMQENTLLAVSEPHSEEEKVLRKIKVVVTGYSSTPWETDDTPHITASGTWVKEGIVATNLLPFGTEVRLPEIYGDEVFVVEDRMHPRNVYHVDVWFPTYWDALNFGATTTYIEVLEG